MPWTASASSGSMAFNTFTSPVFSPLGPASAAARVARLASAVIVVVAAGGEEEDGDGWHRQ